MKRKPIAFCLVLLLNVFTVLLPAHGLPAQSIAAGAQVKGSTIQLAGLRRNVTVQRDERGIPYIEAANEEDLYFAQGYVVAGDRLWQMDLLRRTARGELSEIFGRATLEEDKRFRRACRTDGQPFVSTSALGGRSIRAWCQCLHRIAG